MKIRLSQLHQIIKEEARGIKQAARKKSTTFDQAGFDAYESEHKLREQNMLWSKFTRSYPRLVALVDRNTFFSEYDKREDALGYGGGSMDETDELDLFLKILNKSV